MRVVHERVAVMCGSGIGRTGVALAILRGAPADAVVDWIYPRAVETPGGVGGSSGWEHGRFSVGVSDDDHRECALTRRFIRKAKQVGKSAN